MGSGNGSTVARNGQHRNGHAGNGNSREESCRRGACHIEYGRAEDHYSEWPSPICIISDGPYGVNGFPGDERKAETLADWYRPHIEAWSRRSTPETTLWFWNTELG